MPILAALALAAAQPAPQPLPVHIGGRVIHEGDGSLGFGWPGIYFESRFHGPAVRVRFDAPNEAMSLLIDGAEKRRFDHAGSVDTTIDGLPPGDHLVRLEKLTESQVGGGRFVGFFPGAGSTPLAPPDRVRQIEFIGDSHSVGYGDMSQTHECTRPEVHDRTNTQLAFGSLVARHYEADYRINAYSGAGIVRNYDGSSPGQNLPSLYPRLKPDDVVHVEAADAGWHPALIIIHLGNNDFSTKLHAGERWPDQASLRADYRASYIRFVEMLHARQPQARFLLVGGDEFFDRLEEVRAALESSMPGRVTTVHVTGLDLGGCDWHPSLADHQRLAQQLETAIDGLGAFPAASPR